MEGVVNRRRHAQLLTVYPNLPLYQEASQVELPPGASVTALLTG